MIGVVVFDGTTILNEAIAAISKRIARCGLSQHLAHKAGFKSPNGFTGN